jgi:hypothetical protein
MLQATSLIQLIIHNLKIMNNFLHSLVGHTDLYQAKKQVIREILAFTKFPKSRTSRAYLWEKDIQELAQMHRELLTYRTMQLEIA